MRLRVGDAPGSEQSFHLDAVGRQRPSAVGRQPREDDVDRRIEPDRQPIEIDRAAIVGLDERAAAGGHHDVTQRQQHLEDVLSTLRKYGSPARAKFDRTPLPRLDQLVDVFRAPAESTGQRTRHRRLASGHEADQINFVGRHRVRRSSASKNPGYDTSTDDAPRIVVGWAAPVAATAKAIASR